MMSINRQTVHEKVSRTCDMAAGSNSTSKGLKDYIKDLLKSVGLKSSGDGTARDFLRDFGGGI